MNFADSPEYNIMLSKQKLLLDFKIARKSRIPCQPKNMKYYLDALDDNLGTPGNDYLGGRKPNEFDKWPIYLVQSYQ